MLGRGEAGAPAVVVPGGPRLTYRELREEVSRGAEALAALGLRRDQAIGMVFENGPEAIVLFLAVAAVGAAAPLNPAYTEAELRFYLDDVDAGALIVPPGGAAAARAARPDGAVLVEASIDADGRLRVEAPGRPATTAEPEEPAAQDVALMLHTSGTTGRPKRVPLRHRNLVLGGADHPPHGAVPRPGRAARRDRFAAVRPLVQLRAAAGADGRHRAAAGRPGAGGLRDDRGLPPDRLQPAAAGAARAGLGGPWHRGRGGGAGRLRRLACGRDGRPGGDQGPQRDRRLRRQPAGQRRVVSWRLVPHRRPGRAR